MSALPALNLLPDADRHALPDVDLQALTDLQAHADPQVLPAAISQALPDADIPNVDLPNAELQVAPPHHVLPEVLPDTDLPNAELQVAPHVPHHVLHDVDLHLPGADSQVQPDADLPHAESQVAPHVPPHHVLPEADLHLPGADSLALPDISPPHAHDPDHKSAPSESDSGIAIPSEPDLDQEHRSNIIEEIFQKVEQESERRAREELLEDGRSRPSTANRPPSAGKGASTPRDVRDRRRGSISVSRFGQAADLSSGTFDNPSNLPSRRNSLILKSGNKGAFYKAQKHVGSVDSFASDDEGGINVPAHEDEEQVTQMETIAGRVSLGKAMGRTIARRLSRARTRSRDILAVPNGLVIGVSVVEATTETEHHEGEGEGEVPLTPSGVFAFAEAQSSGSRSRRSTVSMPNPPASLVPPASPTTPSAPVVEKKTSSWVTKAKDFTKMIKRRSMAVLPQQNSNSSP